VSRLFDRERGARSGALTLAGRWSDLDWLNGTLSVQRGIVRHGDVVTDEMSRAASRVAGLALNGAQAERKAS
jgi:hypothetical protein